MHLIYKSLLSIDLCVFWIYAPYIIGLLDFQTSACLALQTFSISWFKLNTFILPVFREELEFFVSAIWQMMQSWGSDSGDEVHVLIYWVEWVNCYILYLVCISLELKHVWVSLGQEVCLDDKPLYC